MVSYLVTMCHSALLEVYFMFKDKLVSYSGVQPSGNLTIGNYLGAIRNFSTYSDEYKCFYCVVYRRRCATLRV